jgi:hypothetical protein
MPQMMTHKVHLTRTNLAGKCAMTHNGQSLGVSKTPLFSAARKLLQLDLAKPEDRIETYRDGIMSMAGPVWAAAKLSVNEGTPDGRPRFVMYRPGPAERGRQVAGEGR